jgi:hypothetical protein
MNPKQTREPGGVHPYYGNYLTSTAGISLLILLLLFISAGLGTWLTHPDEIGITLAFLGPVLIFPIGFGSNLFYFCISGSYLEIRNHIFPWYLKIVHLEEIERVEFRMGSFRRSDALRLKKKESDWTSGYHAGSLRFENWKALEKALQRRGIAVDNRIHGITSRIQDPTNADSRSTD